MYKSRNQDKPLKFYACPHPCPHKRVAVRREGPLLNHCFIFDGYGGNISKHAALADAHPYCSDHCQFKFNSILKSGRKKSRDATSAEIRRWLPLLSGYALQSGESKKRDWYLKFADKNPHYRSHLFSAPPSEPPPPLQHVYRWSYRCA